MAIAINTLLRNVLSSNYDVPHEISDVITSFVPIQDFAQYLQETEKKPKSYCDFTDCCDLTGCHLTNALIKEIPPHITQVCLRQCDLDPIDLGKISDKVTTLDLSDTEISNLNQLPEGVIYLDLKRCDLDLIDLSEIPYNVKNVDLRNAKLSNLGLSKIPKNVTYIDLSQCKLDNINLKEIRVHGLNLGECDLTVVNQDVFPIHVKEIFFTNCIIDENVLKNLKAALDMPGQNIQTLHLEGWKLKPQDIQELRSKLSYLYI